MERKSSVSAAPARRVACDRRTTRITLEGDKRGIQRRDGNVAKVENEDVDSTMHRLLPTQGREGRCWDQNDGIWAMGLDAKSKRTSARTRRLGAKGGCSARVVVWRLRRWWQRLGRPFSGSTDPQPPDDVGPLGTPSWPTGGAEALGSLQRTPAGSVCQTAAWKGVPKAWAGERARP